MQQKLVILCLIIFVIACQKTAPLLGDDLMDIPYAPTSYVFDQIEGLPPMEVPADNPMTAEGIELGRYLFYDPILSRDSSVSCSSCHQIEKAFTDGLAVSEGIDGLTGRRSAMSLINVGYNWVRNRPHNFMWDGRFATLEEQALAPVEDPLEMDANWEDVVERLKQHPEYPRMFRAAFGIADRQYITKHLVGKAIAQFERTLNSASSVYDSIETVGFYYNQLTALEQKGYLLFMGETSQAGIKDAECLHCHSVSNNKRLVARNDFSNNGLDSTSSFYSFVDNGLGDVTGDPTQNGMFREVTLRNIAITAPYMHDGRFATLREVLDHYATGGHAAPNLAPEISTALDLQSLSEADKDALEAFLHTFTDTSYIHNANWKSPF